MSLSNENNKFSLVLNLGDINVTTTFMALQTERKMKITKFLVGDGTGIAQNDSNYAVVALKNGATLIADYSTKLTGGDGALVANTPAEGTIESGQDTQAADSVLTLVATLTGTTTLDKLFVQVDGFYL